MQKKVAGPTLVPEPEIVNTFPLPPIEKVVGEPPDPPTKPAAPVVVMPPSWDAFPPCVSRDGRYVVAKLAELPS